MHQKLSVMLIVLSLIGVTDSTWAKDVSGRLGIGYTDQFSIDIPSVTVQYYPNQELGVSTTLGVDTQEGNSKFGFMVKVYRILFVENQMNFYIGSGAAIISQKWTSKLPSNKASDADKNSDDNVTGFELNGYVGGEFFIPGLDSLGFSFEAGVGITSMSSHVRFRTFGDHPVKAGIIFYF